MASMRSIKRRKGSIESTQQITKAMKLVSTVKLQRAKGRAEKSKSYFECMYATVKSVLAKSGNINHPYLQAGDSTKKAVIVITSNRGLAGGYNSNVIKLITKGDFSKADTALYTVGTKGKDYFSHHGYEVVKDYSDVIEEPVYADAMRISEDLLKAFSDGEVGEIYLAYTGFKNTVVHEPKLIKLLPISVEEIMKDVEIDTLTLMNFEPEADEALDMIIPKYMNNIIYGAFVEAIASENGARMQAMDSATKNAEDMIDDLSLKYNRARQSSITQELTEIIAGAEAIS